MIARPALRTQDPAESPAIHQVPSSAVLSFRGVQRDWGRGSKRKTVLRDVNLEVAPGTTTLIQGPNGAGKTTLLRIASGMLAPNRGTVILDGIPSGRRWRDYHRQVGFLSAGDRGLYVRFSPESHLDYWAKLAFLPRSSRREAVQEALERFGLVDFADRRADRLSQGQRQRVRLAMTFVHKPKVLLLDEPRNSLDADGLGLLVSAVDNALAHGAAVLWCSPTDEQQPIGFDRQLVIQDGAVVPQ